MAFRRRHAAIRKVYESVRSASEANSVRAGVDLLAVSDLGQRTTLRVIFAQMPRVTAVISGQEGWQRPRGWMARSIVIAAGGLTAGSVTWISWGLLTPGDYFGSGNPALWGTLAVVGLAGAYMAARIASRWVSAALLLASACCVAFWIVVPDG